MAKWTPIMDFEDAMIDLQPEYDMIYGKAENSHSLWDGSNLYNRAQLKDSYSCGSGKLQYSLANPEFEAKTGELAVKSSKIDENDSDSEHTSEREIIWMLRNMGLESDLDGELDSKRTLPTVQSQKKYLYNGRSKFIVFLDGEYFKLRPKNKSSKSNSSNEESANEIETVVNTSTKATTSSNTAIENLESSTRLLKYHENMKFYTPREIYYKKRGCINKKNELSTTMSTTITATSPSSSFSSSFSFSTEA